MKKTISGGPIHGPKARKKKGKHSRGMKKKGY